MIAYICNKCKKSIDLSKKCIHLHISCGERAITSVGKFGDSWDADLCEDCAVQLLPYIDSYYYGGNEYLKADKQIIKEERKKVVAELQEWNNKLIDEGYIIEYEDLEQKLNELKEIK